MTTAVRALTLAVAVFFGVQGNLQATEVIKLATLAPEGSPWHEAIRDIGTAWHAASNRQIEIRIYPGGISGDEPDIVRKMRVGQLQAAALTGVGLARIVPEIQALQMPMMFRTDAELDYVRTALSPRLEALLEARGFKLLSWGDAGWVHFFARRPFVHPDDLKPMKIFTWAGDPVVVEAYRASGYQPVPLPATEIHAALQSGMIDAFPTTPIAALSFQWFGLAPNMADVRWSPLVGGVVITRQAWDRLPAHLRPMLQSQARATGEGLQQRVRALETEAIKVMKSHGLAVHHVPPATVSAWETSARAGYPRLVGALVPAEMVREVERLRAQFRAGRGP